MLPLTWSGHHIGRRLLNGPLRPAVGMLVMGAGLLTIAAPMLMTAVPALHGPLAALGCLPA
jgi:hypothetical protein